MTARLAIAACVVALAVPGTAGAATIAFDGDRYLVELAAAPGEANDVVLDEDALTGALVVTDAGAPLEPGGGCEAVNAHVARCPAWSPGGDLDLAVDLGDGDDRLDVAPVRAGKLLTVRGTIAVDGGDGDDVIDATRAAFTVLDGGPGRDELRAGTVGGSLDGGDDVEPDVLVGGPRQDVVSYAGHVAPVTVDLADPGPDGAAGEGDTIRRVEGVIGSRHADRLSGDDRDNVFFGGRGRDVLRGRGGDDGFGTRLIVSLPDPPTGSATGDRVSCGAGDDVVRGRRTSDYTPPGCEEVIVRRALPKSLGGSAPILLDAYPRGRRLSVFCSSREDFSDPAIARLHCSGAVRLRDPSHRLLASGRLARGRGTLRTRLRLTALGRRTAGRPGGVRARVRFSGRNLPTDGWTIALRR